MVFPATDALLAPMLSNYTDVIAPAAAATVCAMMSDDNAVVIILSFLHSKHLVGVFNSFSWSISDFYCASLIF